MQFCSRCSASYADLVILAAIARQLAPAGKEDEVVGFCFNQDFLVRPNGAD